MQITIIRGKVKGDYEYIGFAFFKDWDISVLRTLLEDSVVEYCTAFIERNGFSGDREEFLRIPLVQGNVRAVFLAGLGERAKAQEDDFRRAVFTLVRSAASEGGNSVALCIPASEGRVRSRSIAEGASLAGYRFNKYLSPDPKDKFNPPASVGVFCADSQGLKEGQILGESQMYSRDLCNEPGNIINPATLELAARRLAEEVGLQCTVWDAKQLEEKGMGALTAVGRGSATPPRLIHLVWEPENKEVMGTLALVGKGLTFDSGGLSLKPADGMLTMKGDKTGACVVMGAIRAAALLDLPVKVHMLVGAAENMPGGRAYRPDDILRAYNDKTIEVNNTDAEGRLTLADVLAYVCEDVRPDEIIDIATLTGACAVALGDYTAGIFTNTPTFSKRFLESAALSGERFWQFPMDDAQLRKKLKSPVADLVNSAGRTGGAITAAMFLEAFVNEATPWIHLDIAAVDYAKEPYSYYSKGATAYGMRTLALYLMERCRVD